MDGVKRLLDNELKWLLKIRVSFILQKEKWICRLYTKRIIYRNSVRCALSAKHARVAFSLRIIFCTKRCFPGGVHTAPLQK